MSVAAPSRVRDSADIAAEIVACFGFLPPIFGPASDTPAVFENLWQQTLLAYVNNPLPALFKERLFAYLSRWCRVPYCIVCHSCALAPLGMTATEVLQLLETPSSLEHDLEPSLDLCAATVSPLERWPEPESALDRAVFSCSVAVFRQTCPDDRASMLLRRVLGPTLFSHLTAFLGYVRTCHLWVEAHPELSFEADDRVRQHLSDLLLEEPALGDFLSNYRSRLATENEVQTERALAVERELRQAAEQAAAERTRVAAALRASEERLRFVADRAQVGYWHQDLANDRHLWSPWCYRLFGIPEGELISSERLEAAVHPGDLQRLREAVQSCLVSDGVLDIEYRALWPDGTIRWIHAKGSASYEDGQPTQMAGIVLDITDRKQADVALRESAELVRTIAENSTQALVMMDERGYVTYCNDACLAMTGYSAEEIRSKPLHELIHHHYPDGRPYPMAQCPIDRALPENFDVRAHEDLFFRKDGSTFMVTCAASPIFKNGRPVSTVIEIRDVTDAKRAEAALRESEARFRALADNMSQLAWMTDGAGARLWFNRRWLEYTGVSSSDVQGSGWQKIHHPDHVDRVVEKYRRHLETGQPWEDSFPLRGADGSYRWFLGQAVPVRDASGHIVCWFGTDTDITTQRDAEETLRRAVELRDEFLSVASHELRTPLTALGLQLENLQRLVNRELGAEIGEGVSKRVKVAVRQAERLGGLVEGLLDVSRIASGKMALQLDSFDLRGLVGETVERLAEVAQRSGCEVRVRAGEPLLGTWDRSRIDQVLMNLIGNAIKYGSGQPVEVRLRAAGEWVELAVVDRGIGISQADQHRIFGRFERAVPVSNYGGLGLGLYIANEIVAAHGGTIALDSRAGEGATFTVRLPKVTMPSESEPAASSRSR